MKWVILIGDEKFCLNSIKAIDHVDCINVADINSNRFVVDYGEDGHIFYEFVENLIRDYEEEELTLIPFSSPRFIMMIYSSEELMKKALKQDNYLEDIFIDNDEGSILHIKEFVMRL